MDKNLSETNMDKNLSTTNKKSLQHYEIVTSKYSSGIIGEGALSLVKLVKEKQTGQLFAMKMVLKITYCF